MSEQQIVRKITIVLRGDAEADVQEALNEAVSRLGQGYSSGADRNDTSGFYFESTDDVPAGEVPA